MHTVQTAKCCMLHGSLHSNHHNCSHYAPLLASWPPPRSSSEGVTSRRDHSLRFAGSGSSASAQAFASSGQSAQNSSSPP